MEQLNLPRHVIEMFEKRWPERFSSRPSMARKSLARSRMNSGTPVELRPRQPRLATDQASKS
jgi:hypothetical protein